MIVFSAPGHPCAWQRVGNANDGHHIDTSRNITQKLSIAWEAKAARVRPVARPGIVLVGVVAYLDPKGAHTPFPTRRKDGDKDNYDKLVMDALNGVAWVDDVQVYSASIDKFYGNEYQIEVVIEYL